jgi:hypothetical protein
MLTSQAEQLLQSGWDGVGYLLAAPQTHPHPETGKQVVYSRKRVAITSEQAADMEVWFHELVAQGYIPFCRFYLKRGKCPMRNSEFKNIIVHRAKVAGWEVIAEFIPRVEDPRIKPEDFANLVKHIALDWFGTESAARQLVVAADVAKRGGTLAFFTSVE